MKSFWNKWIFTLFLIAFLKLESANGLESRVEVLNDRYQVEWTVDIEAETVEFAVTAETKGFVGFGLSFNGAMTGADIVIGGVNTQDGTPYFQDYHGTKNGAPTVDLEQNWELVNATENGNFTLLKFKRVWDTCDDQDVIIDKGTVSMIWSLGETDNIGYHEGSRGALAVNLLDPPLPPVNLTSSYHELSANYTLDGNDTSYWCSVHKRQPTEKTHIIAFKPKLESPEALEFTHHFNIYICKAPEGQDPDDLFGPFVGNDPALCFYSPDLSSIRGHCTLSLYAWSFGGRLLTLPEDVGFPWGEDSTEYYVFEAHINNPKLLSNITFESGVQFYETNQLRPKEAGLLGLAHATSASLFIPPDTTNWTIVGHGSSFCTEQYVPPEGIHLFNVNLHSHISAKKMKFRHFRNNTELPWIARDEHYDFNYQENRPLRDAVTVLPGDHLSVECVYDSTWREVPYPVIGGYPSTDEMCMLFAFYYPKIKTEWFASGYPLNKLVERYGITNITDIRETYPSLDPYVIDPENWRGQKMTKVLNDHVSWTDEEKASLQQELRYGLQYDGCPLPPTEGKKYQPSYIAIPMIFDDGTKQEGTITYPEITEEYTEIRDCDA